MALTTTEEAQLRDLIAKQAELLSLATAEPTIISKLGATKKNISTVTPATVLADADLTFVRQGTQDKSSTISVLKSAMRDINIPTAFNSVLKPTAAPTPSAPSQLLINLNNEVFMWIGTVWMLVGNGHAASVSQSADIVVSDSVYTQLVSIVTPRPGSVLITTSQFFQRTSGSGLACGAYLYKNGAPISRLGLIAMGAAVADTFECSGSTILDVNAGDILSVISTLSSPGSIIKSKASQDSLKYAYLK